MGCFKMTDCGFKSSSSLPARHQISHLLCSTKREGEQRYWPATQFDGTEVLRGLRNLQGRHRPDQGNQRRELGKAGDQCSTTEDRRERKQWEDDIKEWTGLEWNILLRKAKNREEWRKLVVKSTVVPQRSARLRDR